MKDPTMPDGQPETRTQRTHSGAEFEQRALRLLQSYGLKLVCQNFRCKAGEIDIVMEHADVLVFVEVRFRSSERWGGAAASITRAKQQRVRRAAAAFVAKYRRFRAYRMRFDAVCFDPSGEQWIRQAFSD